MKVQDILAHCDHTLLSPSATWEDIRTLCDEGMEYHTASVCIPPCYVKKAKEYVKDRLKICTVVGFPNGDSSTAVKCFEAETAIKDGADEIDTVIHIGALKSGDEDEILEELIALRRVCDGKILKVIIETCLLTEEEKIRMCHIVTKGQADYIKTSTGFSTGGATREDVALLRAKVGPCVKVKAAGGISDLKDAEDFLTLGADRLGSSRIVRLVRNQKNAEFDRY